MGTIESRKFNEFNVFSVDEKTSFLHANLSDDSSFYRGLVKYFLDETRLLKYAENKTNLVFSPERRNYIKIHTHIDENRVYDFDQKNIFILTHDRVVQESTYAMIEKIDFLVIDYHYKALKNVRPK